MGNPGSKTTNLRKQAASSSLPRRARAGFTLIEMMVVCAFILAFAAMLVPNMVNMKRSQDDREFQSALLRLVTQAHEDAIDSGRTVALSSQGNQLVIAEQADTASATFQTQNTPQENLGVDQDKTVKTLDILPSAQLSDFQLVTNTVDGTAESPAESDWKLLFYPDGRSDQGGFTVTIDGQEKSISIDKLGHVSLIDGNLPDTSNSQWIAGDYVHRAQQ